MVRGPSHINVFENEITQKLSSSACTSEVETSSEVETGKH
jgi:hypothetical protein